MALKTYIGPLDETEAVAAGHHLGIVKRHHALVVPDEIAELVGWPEENWADGAPEGTDE